MHRPMPRSLLAVSAVLALFLCRVVPLAAGSRQAPAGQLTLESIFGDQPLHAPLVGGIEWSPDGRTLSYFQPTAFGRELWALDAATGRRKRLIDAATLGRLLDPWPVTWLQRTGFGRQLPQRYFWSPGGGALLLRSSSKLVWYDLESGRSRSLVAGKEPLTDPKISPDGKWVSFIRDYNLWVVNVRTGRERPLTRDGSEALRDGQVDWLYPEELDLFTAYWWSPDSSRIAYLQFNESRVLRYPLIAPDSYGAAIDWTRYPLAGQANPVVRLGVVGVSGGNGHTVWMDTGGDTNIYLPRVAWLPGSGQVAIERLNRAQTRLDLLFADAATGRSRLVLGEKDRYWINVAGAPYFLPDGRFLWLSERTGFRHIYLYDSTGHLIRPLTGGDWVVTHLAGVDRKDGLVYFVATREGPLERQLYRVRLDGTHLARVSRQAGTHEILMAPGAASYLDTDSSVMKPYRQDLYSAAGRRVATLSDGQIPQLAGMRLGPVRFLQLHAADGAMLEAEMILPPVFSPARQYPVIVYVYGGPGEQSVRDMWGSSIFLWHEMMAQKGYIVFLLDNRGTYNRGHAFETPIDHRFGIVDVQDQLVGAHYLLSLPYVDPSRIGVWGWSYGGTMTLHLLFRDGGIFKAGVAVAPVTDWRQYDTVYTERYLGTPEQDPEGYRAGSPVTYAGGLAGKLLIVQGTDDDNVHFSNTTELLGALIEEDLYAGHVQTMILPGRGHPISDTPALFALFERMTDFFLRQLGPAPASPAGHPAGPSN
ncbi:MAG TPA: S9 family peptidase [Candidatus Dormibacteraeota bacterium]|nr:S9 family peptidase [Candidatus Dormibacteraeota bacterium]